MSVWDLLKRGNRTSSDLRTQRLAICELCPSNKAGVCTECGCVLKLKTGLATEDCPLGKWQQ